MTNPFEAYGAEKGKRDKPVRITGKQPMVKHGLEKKQEEEAKQAKLYRAQLRAELQGMIDGPRGTEIAGLQSLLRSYVHNVERESEVITFLDHADWFGSEPLNTRMRIMSMIGHAILRARIRDGRPPFDDPIPLLDSGERPAPEGLFQKAKERLTDADHERNHQADADEQAEGVGARPDTDGGIIRDRHVCEKGVGGEE